MSDLTAHLPQRIGVSRSRAQTQHTAGIKFVVDTHPGMQTKGFWSQVRPIGESLESGFDEQPFRPDCFRIDRENRVVEIHEVVVTHEPKTETLHMMALLWFCFDCDEDWRLKLFIHRRGQTPSEVDLWHWYLDALRTQRGGTNDWGELDA